MKLRGTDTARRKGEYRIVKRKGRIYVLQVKKKKPENNEEGD